MNHLSSLVELSIWFGICFSVTVPKMSISVPLLYTSNKLTYNNTHLTSNIQAVLDQIAMGGGAEHLACVQVPALTI